MTQRIARLSLLVPDYDAAIAFFTGPMRFRLLQDTDLGGGRRWVRVAPAGGGAELVLARADGPAQQAAIGNQCGGRVWLFLETGDFDRDHARMVADGVIFTEQPRHEPYGTVAVFRDPFGNLWDLIQPK